MNIPKQSRFTGIVWILVIAIFGGAFLMIASSYFNTAEINLLSTRCYEVGGEVVLKIYNNFTSEYSFECKK